MPERYRATLNSALEYLLELWAEGVPPREALARLGSLQERHPEARLDLAWEEEGFTGEVDYSVLLHVPGEGTLSLGLCPERAVPWPLRGAHYSREDEIVRVNQWRLRVADVLTFLDFLWKDTGLIRQLVDQALIAQEVARRTLEPSDAELEAAMDAFRREKGLLTVAATQRWLDDHGLTQTALEERLAQGLRQRLLREEVAGGRVEAHFERHRAAYDMVVVSRLFLPDEAAARETFAAIQEGRIGFVEAAETAFLAGNLRSSRPTFARLRRGELPPERAEVLFGTAEGEVVEPARSGAGWEIVRVLRVEPAVLDAATRERVVEALSEEWLEGRRAEAEVEWFWGEVRGTLPRE